MKRVVVTGASGMIGSQLIELLVKNDYYVYAIVRPNSKNISNISIDKNIQIIECDLSNLNTLDNTLQAEYFFHFGWSGVYGKDRNDCFLQEKNVEYCLNSIKTAKSFGCKRFIFAGSQAEFGLQNVMLNPSIIENPTTPYGIAKLACCKMGKLLANDLGIEFVEGRILSCYGKNDTPSTLISSLISKLLSGLDCDLSSCKQVWDFINVFDAANAFLSIAERGVNHKSYIIASGVGKELKAYVEEIYKIISPTPSKLNFGAIPQNEKSIKYLVGDISDLVNDTGYKPQVLFKDGIVETINWMKKNSLKYNIEIKKD